MEASNKNRKSEERQQLPGGAIKKIRDELRAWYGSLSIKELTTNRVLVTEIERLEKLLSQGLVTA